MKLAAGIVFWTLALLPITVLPGSVRATEVPAELQGVGITEHLGAQVSLQDLSFKDETGQNVHLGDFFHAGRPVLLALVYYECPNLCTFVLNGMVASLKKLDWTVGQKFDVVAISIDPAETPELAREKKKAYLAEYGHPESVAGWHFLTGRQTEIKRVASEIGFGYRYLKEEQQFAHSAALYVLTPEGKISRYLYGIEYRPKDVRLALLEASSGRIGTVVDRIILFCCHYDPMTKKYTLYVFHLMQIACGVTVLLLGIFLFGFWSKQVKKGA